MTKEELIQLRTMLKRYPRDFTVDEINDDIDKQIAYIETIYEA